MSGRTASQELAEAYVETVRQHFRSVEETCRGLQVLYTRADVLDPIERIVPALLKRGALAR